MSLTPRRIVFVDITCPFPYDTETLRTKPMGGSEATLVRIAEALAETGRYEVSVLQHNRIERGIGKALYVGFDELDEIQGTPHAVIAFRQPNILPFIKKTWGDAPKKFLWLEDFNQAECAREYSILSDNQTKILAVSKMHKMVVIDALLSTIKTIKDVTVDYVYNPIEEAIVADSTPVDPNKFLFFSSPHKGLELTLKHFERLRHQLPEARLYVANPGYIEDMQNLPDFVTNLGPLPHAEMIRNVRDAFCVFHMNHVFPETFGIVHAEANAVGTPVLTSYTGANNEILRDQGQIVDVRDQEKVVDRVLLWKRYGRPQVTLSPDFRLSNVLKKWEKLLS